MELCIRRCLLCRAVSTAFQMAAALLPLRRSRRRLNCPLWIRRSSSRLAIVIAAASIRLNPSIGPLAGRVTDQNPADRYRRNTGMVPKRGAGGDQQPALLGIVPLRYDHARPDCLLVLQHGAQLRQSTPLQRRAAPLTWPAFGCWAEQAGIQPQPGDHTDIAADDGKQFERREAVVGDEYQTAIWQPAFGLQDRLPGPRRQRLVALAIGFAPACRGRQDRQDVFRRAILTP